MFSKSQAQSVRDALWTIYHYLDSLLIPFTVPGIPKVVAHRESDLIMSTGSTQTFSYTIQAPPAADPSSTTLKFYAMVAGVVQPPVNFTPGGKAEAITGVPIGATVDCYFTELDASGNESGPGPHLTFTAVDDIAPGAPTVAPTIVSHVESGASKVGPTPNA